MPRPTPQNVCLKLAVTVVATGAIVFKTIYPEWNVDAVTLGLFLAALLPWLAPLIKSVELPGGLKVELQEIKESIEQTRGTAESARQRAEFAVIQGETTAARPANVTSRSSVADTWTATADALVKEYNRVRDEMPSGPPRTQKMTEIFTKMIDASHENPTWDVGANLQHADRGWRLMAYAFAYARPDFSLFVPLVASACDFTDDNKPFGQYWSILAIERMLGVRQQAGVGHREWTRLNDLYRWLIPGTDRHEEMRRVMESLKPTTRA